MCDGLWGSLGRSLVRGMLAAACLAAQGVRADTFATYRSDTPGQYPDAAFLHRPYYVEFKSNIDGATDWFSIFLPSDFDPDQVYPVWFKFKPYYGSGSHVTGPSHAWNYSDSNDVIVIGCNLRGTPDAWFGDNENMDPVLASNIVADTKEIFSQLVHVFKISYAAASGASMGGYSSLRFLTHLPQDYVGAAVASCPAIWFRPWVQTGSDYLYNQIGNGFFNEKFVMLLHGTADDTVPVQYSRDMTAAAPDTNGWQLVEIPGGGHAEYFAKFDYANYSYPYDEQYGQSPIVSNLWSQIHAWEAAHPALAANYRPDLPGWTPPTNWYLPQALYDVRPAKITTNTAPAVNAGTNQAITLPATAVLAGTASDDGLPTNQLTVAWSKVSGPGVVTFTNAATAHTRASFSTDGVYVLRLTADDTALGATDDVQVTVNPAGVNEAPTVSAGPDRTNTLPALVTLAGTVGDDGLPSNALTVVWTKVSGPGTVDFTNAATANTRASFSTNGAYVLRLVASDTALSATDEVQVTVNPASVSGVVTVQLQKGVSPGTNFVGCKDSTFRSLTGASFGLHSLGKDVSLEPRWRDFEGSGVVWFDLSSVPSYATIQSATLKLWHEPSEFENTSGRLLVHPLHDPNGTGMWDENTGSNTADYGTGAVAGCALFKRPGVAWASSGEGRYTEVISGAETVTSLLHTAGVTGWLSIAVTRDVSIYVTNSAMNLGWIFYSAADDTIRGQLHTADSAAAKRPMLEIVYDGTPPTNQPPAVSAGTNQTITLPATAVLNGSASDDGLPSNMLAVAWSVVSGPGAVTFTNTATAISRASFATDGVYVLRLVASDTAFAATSEVQVTVQPQGPNQPPILAAIGNQSVAANMLLSFGVSATDPESGAITYSASNLPAGAVFSSQTFTWTPSAGQTGVHAVTFYARDPELEQDSETVQITVEPPPGVNTNGSGRVVPPLSELLAASLYLDTGDIPEDTFLPPTNVLFVAASGGSDANPGTIGSPYATLDKAITVAAANAAVPYTIYLRGGTHYFKTVNIYIEINRGNLFISGYSNEAVTIRPFFWPANPTASWEQRCFVVNGSFSNVTFNSLKLEGWQIGFDFYSSLASPPLRQMTMKNIVATNFVHRDNDPNQFRVFMETGYLTDDVYGAGKQIFTNPATAHYQVENMILSNIEVYDTDITINVGDENDANIKGLRISDFRLINPPQALGGTSANDGFAIVNSAKVLIDSCVIKNVNDDGIDTKSFDVAVINTLVQGTGRNGVKFWRNGELINSMIHACTPINDGAFIMKEGPCRVINSLLMSKTNGYASTMGYGETPSLVGGFEIVNSIFADTDGPMYVVHTNFTSRNSIYYDMRSAIFEYPLGFITTVGALNARPGSTGNLGVNPLLSDPAASDFMPQAGSPCIDGGTSTDVLLPAFDYYGRDRILGAQPDIGPVEYDADSFLPSIGGAEIVQGAVPSCVIRWLGEQGVTYSVSAAGNLAGPWSPIVSNIPGTGAMLAVTNLPGGDDVGFFRVQALAP